LLEQSPLQSYELIFGTDFRPTKPGCPVRHNITAANFLTPEEVKDIFSENIEALFEGKVRLQWRRKWTCITPSSAENRK